MLVRSVAKYLALGLQAMLGEQGTAAWVAPRVGVVLSQDGVAFRRRQRWAVDGMRGLVHGDLLAP